MRILPSRPPFLRLAHSSSSSASPALPLPRPRSLSPSLPPSASPFPCDRERMSDDDALDDGVLPPLPPNLAWEVPTPRNLDTLRRAGAERTPSVAAGGAASRGGVASAVTAVRATQRLLSRPSC